MGEFNILPGGGQYGGGSYYHAWLTKVDINGKVLWNLNYGGNTTQRDGEINVYSGIQTEDGGFALAGAVNGVVWLGKTDSNGTMQWNQTYAFTNYAQSLMQTNDGGYMLDCNVALAKVNATGALQWTINWAYAAAKSMIKTSDGGVVLAGQNYMVRVNSNGAIQWNCTYTQGTIRQAIQCSDGGFALAGTCNNCGILIKTDSNGTALWVKTYNGTLTSGLSIVQTNDGFILSGENNTGRVIGEIYPELVFDDLLIKTDLNGNLQWKQYFGYNCPIHEIVFTKDSGLLLSRYHPLNRYGGNWWIIKVK
jgi:hypothetical protein